MLSFGIVSVYGELRFPIFMLTCFSLVRLCHSHVDGAISGWLYGFLLVKWIESATLLTKEGHARAHF